MCQTCFKKEVKTLFTFLLLLIFISLQAKAQESKILNKQDFSDEIKDYKRSSLFVMVIDSLNSKYGDIIKNTINELKFPKNFNDHKLNIKPFVEIDYTSKDQVIRLTKKLKELDIAKQLVAKWFKRDQNGFFDLDLVKERGLYNASAFDIQIAKHTVRGSAMLEDAGEHLIGNTFVIVHDFKYTNKENVAKVSKSLIKIFEGTTGKSTGATASAVDTFGKGYVVKTTTYLYRLVWDEEVSTIFFSQFWVNKKYPDKARIKAFEETNAFKLEYIGKQDVWVDVFSTKYTQKSEQELIERAIIKASNSALARLQRKFEVFRTKSPLISIDPIAAKIGCKEGLEKGDRFEVLEQVLQEDGIVTYKKVTEITVDKNNIWDNSYLPDEQPKSDLEYTLFKGKTKKIYPGMLIRFKRNQNLLKL